MEQPDSKRNWLPYPWQVQIVPESNDSWIHSIWISLCGCIGLILFSLWYTLYGTVALFLGHVVRLLYSFWVTFVTVCKLLFYGLMGFANSNDNTLAAVTAEYVQRFLGMKK